MARLMALDVGEARIGVAICDASGILASPYATLRVSRDAAQLWKAIQDVIDEAEVEGLVVGLPISLDGELHAQGERVRAFAARLQQHIRIPLTFWDERYSTVEAERLRGELYQVASEQETRRRGGQGGHVRPRKEKQRGRQGIDALAAAVILQDYLEHISDKAKDNTI